MNVKNGRIELPVATSRLTRDEAPPDGGEVFTKLPELLRRYG